MERRNWTLKSLEELTYIDSLDDKQRAESLVTWIEKYTLTTSSCEIPIEKENFTPVLSETQIINFLELFYKNINFLKSFKSNLKSKIESSQKIKSFLK